MKRRDTNLVALFAVVATHLTTRNNKIISSSALEISLFVAFILPACKRGDDKTGQNAQISDLLRESQECNSTLQHLLGHYTVQCEAQDDGSIDPALNHLCIHLTLTREPRASAEPAATRWVGGAIIATPPRPAARGQWRRCWLLGVAT